MSIALRTFPADDSDFETLATELLPDAHEPQQLEDALRPAYPHATVHDGVKIGDVTLWYAYRDGRWRPSGVSAEDGAASLSSRHNADQRFDRGGDAEPR